MGDFIDETRDLLRRTPDVLSALLAEGTTKAFEPFDRFAHEGRGDASTLDQLIERFAELRLDHVAQVYGGLAGSHDAAVGPWKSHLGILLRRDDPAAIPG